MPKPVPSASRLAPCPLRDISPDRLRHLAWKDPDSGWVVAYGTPKVWELVAAGLPCWHLAMDAARRKWMSRPPCGWTAPGFRVNAPLELPDDQTVCDVCWSDLTGGAR